MVKPLLDVEVVYANPERQTLISLQVELGACVNEAIQQSDILSQYPEIDLQHYKVGIFSKIVLLDAILRAGDRVEIYHPLLIDPKKARLLRAKRQKNSINNR